MVHVIKCRNVCEALPLGLTYLTDAGKLKDTRAGKAFVAPGPVATVYTHPTERILFSAERDVNPAFHLIEAMWMLMGRDDATFLDNYIPSFGERFGEPDGRIHGAYGNRWRKAFGIDQIKEIINKLRVNKGDRQAVLQMWDCRDDGWGKADLLGDWKDRPCNTHVYFRINENKLDMTVCCRSNDIIWGAYGANVVHFSFLQEYIAAMVGTPIGTYTQFSNNYHAYVSEMEKIAKRFGTKGVPIAHVREFPWHLLNDNRYTKEPWKFYSQPPLVAGVESFDQELLRLEQALMTLQGELATRVIVPKYGNPFLWETVYKVALCHKLYREGNINGALDIAPGIGASDWRIALTEWLERRRDAKRI